MSGDKIYCNRRTHGRAELRDAFIGAAESALRTDTKLKEYYNILRAKGVGDKDAKVALARKIAALCLALLKNNDTYQDDFEEQQHVVSNTHFQARKVTARQDSAQVASQAPLVTIARDNATNGTLAPDD